MKIKLLLLSLLTATAFVGCSDDDLSDQQGGKPGSGELRYLAVNIVTPKESINRAATDGGFEDGTQEEVAVNSALFILLNKANEVVLTSTVTGDHLKPWSDGDGATGTTVDKISSAVLAIDGKETDPNITGILAVLNPKGSITTKILANMSLAEVKAIVDAYAADGTENSFVMSNSAYVDGSTAMLAAKVAKENMAKTADAAKNHPVDIYVERVVAKIRTTATAGIKIGEDDNSGNVKVTIAGTGEGTGEKNLKINIKGVQIANSADKSYLFKNIDGITNPFDGWNNALFHRSYWANMPQTGVAYTNYSWNQISDEGTAITDAATFYTQENILPYASKTGHTAVIIAAQLTDQAGAPFQLVKIAGIYYTPDNALKELAGYLNNRGYRIKTVTTEGDNTTTTYETLNPNGETPCLKWLTTTPTVTVNGEASSEKTSEIKGWQGFAEMNPDYTNGKSFVYWDPANEVWVDKSVEDLNRTLLSDAFRVWKWTDGKCYYFVDIEHFGTESVTEDEITKTVYRKGIVRNHIYDLNLKSLKGVGVPVFDPEKVIIPEKPDDDQMFYLSAKINVLMWKLVSQEVNFN